MAGSDDFTEFFGFTLFAGNTGRLSDLMDQALAGPRARTSIMCLNPHSFVVAGRDGAFHRSLRGSSILVPDGIGVVAAGRALRREVAQRISGLEVTLMLLGKLDRTQGSVFFLGSTAASLQRILGRVAAQFPNIRCHARAPSFAAELSASESADIVREINQAAPTLLCVGMSAPKQEKWVHRHLQALDVRVVCCVGAAFDYLAGTIPPPPQWVLVHHIEWLYRLCREPRRLWRRTLLSGPRFAWCVIQARIRQNPIGNPRP